MDFINKNNLRSWAKEYKDNYEIYYPKNIDEIKFILKDKKRIITSGGYRSYGDSAINKTIINTKYFNKILSFDEKEGIIRAEAGVTIDAIIKYLLPKGWFLKVTPGTKFSTLGGCIASDVHGKEHHQEGCFSESIINIKMLINKNDSIKFNKNNHPNLFYSTCGGMGLTGLILEAEIKCKKIYSSQIDYQKTINYNLDQVFLCFEKYKDHNYSVAWLDTKKRKNDYRSIFTYGNFSKKPILKVNKSLRLSIPLSFRVVNNLTVVLFNYFYFFLNRFSKDTGSTNYDNFFYPLDKIKNWYKLYGKKGFVQYQFVVPKINGKKCLKEVLDLMNNTGSISSLAVLKLHNKSNNNYLTFPLEGYSLAMDFPINDKLYSTLDNLDNIVSNYKGKIYLTKDCRLKKYYFEKFYPKSKELTKTRNQYKIFNFESYQSKRVGINE